MSMRLEQLVGLIVLLGLSLPSTAVIAADGNAEGLRAEKQKQSTPKSKYSAMAMEAVANVIAKGQETLKAIVDDEDSAVDRHMRELQDVVGAVSERARRLSNWDMAKVKKDAEKSFDTTIGAVEAYIALVEDDGPVHKASKRIRADALTLERTFREKADAKSGKTAQKYGDLAKTMQEQAKRISVAWEAIRAERKKAEEALANLKECRELYVDIKQAKGVEAAVKELEAVADDLRQVSNAMMRVQDAVIGMSGPTT
jgi:hypothetical protein